MRNKRTPKLDEQASLGVRCAPQIEKYGICCALTDPVGVPIRSTERTISGQPDVARVRDKEFSAVLSVKTVVHEG